jgi:endothelin-converting enzyme
MIISHLASIASGKFADTLQYYYQVFPITYLDKLVPEISTTNYLKAQAPSGYPIDSNRTAIIGDINYYRALSKIIQATPRDTLHAYFKWRLMGAYQMRLHKDFTLPMRQFGNRLSGRDANTVSDRWRICLSELDSGLSNLYSAAFIERAFTSKDKDLGDRIIHDIKTVFSERLKGFDWMSDKSKNIAAKKGLYLIRCSLGLSI